jgi:hypothetical protein
MAGAGRGLTATYHRVHDAGDRSAAVAGLRARHVALDEAVAAAYGWSDLALGHGHGATPAGGRFAVGARAGAELVERLLELNHRRHVTERSGVEAG